MSYFNYQGKNVFYEEMGNGSPLFLLHGNTASSNMFYEIAGKYAEHHRVILIDLRRLCCKLLQRKAQQHSCNRGMSRIE